MKTDKEGLGGYVAEMFCSFHMRDTGHKNMCNFFGTQVDKVGKRDFMWESEDNLDMFGDCKGSIIHPNCSVEADHPFFKKKPYNSYFFIFPFRDETSIYIVNAHLLHENILKNKIPRRGNRHDYYVVTVNDILSLLDSSSYYTIPLTGKYKTFGMFFNTFFRGDELVGMSESNIIEYIETNVKPLCENYDIPVD